MSSKSIRSWVASLLFLLMVLLILSFLAQRQIPEKNKDIIVSIIGMIVGSMSMAISIFVGRDPDDVAQLRKELESLNDDRSTLIARLRDAQIDKDVLRKQLEGLQGLVIERLSLLAGDRKLGELADISHHRELPAEFAEWIPEKKDLRLETPPPSQPRPVAPPAITPAPRSFDDVMKGDD
jgi:hypothetical protein